MADLADLHGKLCQVHNAEIVVGKSGNNALCRGGNYSQNPKCDVKVLRAYSASLNGYVKGGDADDRSRRPGQDDESPAIEGRVGSGRSEKASAPADGTEALWRKGGSANGLQAQPTAIDDTLQVWRAKVFQTAETLLRHPDAHYNQKAVPARELILPLAEDLKEGLRMLQVRPPQELTRTDIEEECERLARMAVEQWMGGTDLTDKIGDVPAVVAEDYADRMAIDAYLAYEAMVGEKREYSWEGLIRDGCTAVLSALIGSGKSTFAMNLARAWGLGVPFLDRSCRQSRTLVVVSPKEFEAWADTIGFWELKGMVYVVESTKAHFTNREETVRWFDFLMQKFDCRTFVLDTLFDFFGMPPNTSGYSNRIAMNEQTPLLQMVRERNYSGLVTGHAPKSEAKAIDPRDPEESFGGHTAWTAQHRMRMTIRRKTQGVNAFITGKGGYGDKGILKEQLLMFDEETRLDSLGGLFSEHLGVAAMPSVVETLGQIGKAVGIAKLVKEMDKGEKWIRPGLKEGQKQGLVIKEGKGRSTRYRLTNQEPEQGDLAISGANREDLS